MIKWYHHLFLDENVCRKQDKYRKKLQKGKVTVDLYCIALPSNEKNLYDIINCNELLFQYYKRKNIYIIGLAKGYNNTIQMLQQVISYAYDKTGDYGSKRCFDKNSFSD